MLYSVYYKPIVDENIDYYEMPIYDWLILEKGLSIDGVLEIFYAYDMEEEDLFYKNFLYAVLPDIEINNRVFNTKTSEMGVVVDYNKDLSIWINNKYLYQDIFVNDIAFGFATVLCKGEVLNWKINDLIVIEDTTIN